MITSTGCNCSPRAQGKSPSSKIHLFLLDSASFHLPERRFALTHTHKPNTQNDLNLITPLCAPLQAFPLAPSPPQHFILSPSFDAFHVSRFSKMSRILYVCSMAPIILVCEKLCCFPSPTRGRGITPSLHYFAISVSASLVRSLAQRLLFPWGSFVALCQDRE